METIRIIFIVACGIVGVFVGIRFAKWYRNNVDQMDRNDRE